MDFSIIIPTRHRPGKLAQCVRSLSSQQLDPLPGCTGRFEVIVSIDGLDDSVSPHAATDAWSHDSSASFRVVTGEKRGINAARNRGLELASGRWTLFVNDDLYAQPGMLAEHRRAHLESLAHEPTARTGAIVVGDAPWCVHPDDSLFDRLVRETSMIFFYDRMHEYRADGDEPAHAWRDWGFRHCYTLNLSAATRAFHAVGGFRVLPEVYGYDDLEAGWRLGHLLHLPVLFRPRAKGTHDHRYSPDEYLAREHTLGRAAWHLARAEPSCAYDLFGRDITSPDELAYSREFVCREREAVDRIRAAFIELARTPSDAISGPASKRLIQLLYQQHLLLKRWEWRRGLLHAADSAASFEVAPRRASLVA
ncbi:MAG: glycosyltransferase family 2 protein [Phycisphaerales bacterium]